MSAALVILSSVRAENPPARLDDEILRLFSRMQAAYVAATTMSADFSYTVNSDVRHQEVTGQARLMKPNFARLTFTRIAEPAFPNLIGSDGALTYTYVPKRFRGGQRPETTPINPEFRTIPHEPVPDDSNRHPQPLSPPPDRIITNRTFEPGPHDPMLAAQQASGLTAGGIIETERTPPNGFNLKLWDSIALQAFFSFRHGISYLYRFADHPENLKIEDPQELDGVTYTVIHYHFANGNIEGGAKSPFDHRVFVAPDGLIHRYELHFVSNGQPGVQVMQLRNIRLNEPMPTDSFVFTPPGKN